MMYPYYFLFCSSAILLHISTVHALPADSDPKRSYASIPLAPRSTSRPLRPRGNCCSSQQLPDAVEPSPQTYLDDDITWETTDPRFDAMADNLIRDISFAVSFEEPDDSIGPVLVPTFYTNPDGQQYTLEQMRTMNIWRRAWPALYTAAQTDGRLVRQKLG